MWRNPKHHPPESAAAVAPPLTQAPGACPKCGSTQVQETPCESGPHHARRNCADCGRFLNWAAKPAPDEQGTTLARFTRNQGKERLRVSLETYNDHPFVRLQAWTNDGSGWWPTAGKCVTVKRAEVAELARVLTEAAEQLPTPAAPPRQARPGQAPASRPERSAVRSPDRATSPPEGLDDGKPVYVPPRRPRPQPRPLGPPPPARSAPPWVTSSNALPLGSVDTPEFNEFQDHEGSST